MQLMTVAELVELSRHTGKLLEEEHAASRVDTD